MVTKLQYSPYVNENIDETSYWCNDIWKKENIKSKCKSRGEKIENSLSHSTRFRHVTQLQLITGKDEIHNRVLSRKLLSFRARWCVQVHGGNVKPIKFELHQNGGRNCFLTSLTQSRKWSQSGKRLANVEHVPSAP